MLKPDRYMTPSHTPSHRAPGHRNTFLGDASVSLARCNISQFQFASVIIAWTSSHTIRSKENCPMRVQCESAIQHSICPDKSIVCLNYFFFQVLLGIKRMHLLVERFSNRIFGLFLDFFRQISSPANHLRPAFNILLYTLARTVRTVQYCAAMFVNSRFGTLLSLVFC